LLKLSFKAKIKTKDLFLRYKIKVEYKVQSKVLMIIFKIKN